MHTPMPCRAGHQQNWASRWSMPPTLSIRKSHSAYTRARFIILFERHTQSMPCHAGPTRRLGHLLGGRILQLFRLIVMRRNVEKPVGLNLNHLAHELFRGIDKLEIDDPFGKLVAKEAAGGVDMDGLAVLDGAEAVTGLLNTRAVVEKAGCDGLNTSCGCMGETGCGRVLRDGGTLRIARASSGFEVNSISTRSMSPTS